MKKKIIEEKETQRASKAEVPQTTLPVNSTKTITIPESLYWEALYTYDTIRPRTVTQKGAVYLLSDEDRRHLLYMARCHLEANATGSGDAEHRKLCKRLLKQLDALEGSSVEPNGSEVR